MMAALGDEGLGRPDGMGLKGFKISFRPLVQHYLYDMKLKRVQAASKQLDEVRKSGWQ
jgi:hypothetical protein